jgi:hypothetical protein
MQSTLTAELAVRFVSPPKEVSPWTLLLLRGYLILVAVLVAMKFAQLVGGFGH